MFLDLELTILRDAMQADKEEIAPSNKNLLQERDAYIGNLILIVPFC